MEAQEQRPRGAELNFKRQAEVSQAGKRKGSRAARTVGAETCAWMLRAAVCRGQRSLAAVAGMAVWRERYLQMKGHAGIRLEEL